MRGHIRKRERSTKTRGKVTSWHPIVYLGRDPVTGKKHYKEGGGHPTKRDAETVLARMLADLGNGTFVPSNSLTVAEYLLDLWLPSIATRVKPTTLGGYTSVVERYLIPLIGRVKLQELTPAHLNAAYANLLRGQVPPPRRTRPEPPTPGRAYSARRSRPLSPKTVSNTHLVLSKALEDAVDAGLVARNPAQRAKPPRPEKKPIEAWTASELRRFLDWVSNDTLFPLWRFSSMTGLRRGEALAIRLEDVDFDRLRISVRQNLVLVRAGGMQFVTPKGDRPRVVDIDAETAAILRRQKAAVIKQKLSSGSEYRDLDLLFPNEDGTPQRPDSVSRRFAKLVERAISDGVVPRRITFHGLRHSHATIGISAGVPVKVISERLGHASPSFTMTVYQCVIPSMQREAAMTIANIVGAGDDGDGQSAVGANA